jgi:phage tail sheath protein FI
MPIQPTYPGLYVEEVSSGVHPISGVSTSDTAFIDYFPQGPVEEAVRVSSFDGFLREFGPLLDVGSPAGYAVMQYFVNGGQVAWIVRVLGANAAASSVPLNGGSAPSATLTVSARSEGAWGDALQVAVADGSTPGTFTLVVRRIGQVRGRVQVVASEVHSNLTMGVGDPRNVIDVVDAGSELIAVAEAPGGLLQPPSRTAPNGIDVTSPSVINDLSSATAALGFLPLAGGDNGSVVQGGDLIRGLEPLKHIEPAVVNLLCIPAAAELDGANIESTPQLTAVAGAATAFCERFRCFYLLDMPGGVDTPTKALKWLDANTLRHRNVAVAYPRLRITDPDPLRNGKLRTIANSGTLAGLTARMDTESGVWYAPAGTTTQLRSIVAPVGRRLNDDDSAVLNPFGINAIRTLALYGTVAWGTRTLEGADAQASEWKYIPIRRTALFIEETLVQGLRWVVFKPNDEPLWSQIRLNVGAFMQSMFLRGAFQGLSRQQAYLVKCDEETTTQNDRDRGIVNILVGFAPLKPAEFVYIQLQQLTKLAE